MKKIKHMIIISALAMLICIEASASAFAPSLAELLRINTGAEISVVLEADEGEAHSGEGVVSVRRVEGGILCEKIGSLVQNGGEAYPYLSGADMLLEVSSSAGVRKEALTALTLGAEALDAKKVYTVALSQTADAYFEECERIGLYSADNGLLYNYINTFAQYDENEAEAAEAEKNSEEKSDGAENESAVQKQGNILMLTITLFAVVLVIYLFARNKKKQS